MAKQKPSGWLDKFDDNKVVQSDATRTKNTKNVGIKKGPDQSIGNMLDITLGAPQRQLVKMITGKEQSPSEAMGIENPYGAFAADAILDPTNLVGAGLVGKAAKASTKTGILSKAYKINPFAFKPQEGMMYRGLGEEGMADALKSGVFRQAGFDLGIPKYNQVWYAEGPQRFAKAQYFSKDVIAEVPKSSFTQANMDKVIGAPGSGLRGTNQHIPITEGKILKKDWLQGYKPVEVPNINTSSTIANPIAPINKEALKDAYGFLERRQFVKGLQKQGLIGREFGEADARYAARSTDKTNALTKLALDADATYYRGVKGSVPKDGIGYQDYTGRKFNMSEPTYGAKVSEFENMRNAGVDFNNPLSIAEYQASHVPMQEYGYRSGMPSLENVDAIYTSKGPNTYGNYQMRMTLPRDYSEGNYSDWVNKYIKPENNLHDLAAPKGYWEKDFMPDAPYETPVTLDSKSRSVIIGPRGKKMFDVDKTYPYSDYKNLTGDKLKEYKEYLQKGVKDFNTGFRGQYKNGGWLDKYEDGGELNYNDSNASAGPGFEGDGYSNVGRNYSPAWEGQFQMGGSLPGATGSMYARVGAPSKGKDRNKFYKTDASAQNGKEMKFYQEGLDFKPKSISKNGSVIKDDMGQWAYPGEITEIGSNQITMQGVPYPVMGISDTGDTQIMYPNQEYQYDGDSVTEYPMMAQGGQLTKLDQLTNFTNYNTKQPGGWLDKYQ